MQKDEGKWQKSDNFSLVFIGGSLALWLLFHAIWSILFEDWIKHQLEWVFGRKLAEIIEKFGSAGFPLLAAIGVAWFLLAYAKRHYQGNIVDAAIEAQRLHTEALREQTAALRGPPRELYSLPKSQAPSLPTWLELERRFQGARGRATVLPDQSPDRRCRGVLAVRRQCVSRGARTFPCACSASQRATFSRF
jgi:uncharacterized iron-regulated membrane protein